MAAISARYTTYYADHVASANGFGEVHVLPTLALSWVQENVVVDVLAGAGAAIIGGAIGIPMLLKQAKVWDSTISDYETAGKAVPNVLPTLRGKPEKAGKQALPEWMMNKDVEKGDQSVAGWIQRIKNAAFGGLQADIFEVNGAGQQWLMG
jgi:hypothetical protein